MISQEKDFITSSAEAPLPANDADNRLSVLLAEDDKALRRYLEVVLHRAGYRVISAADGLEAMKKALTSRVDIVVTDAVMPNLDGNELCRFLRKSHLAHIPIVLLSALERKDEGKDSEPANAFLAKPISPDELLDCLEGLLATVG
jgi:CheY-like chemotaxis protein